MIDSALDFRDRSSCFAAAEGQGFDLIVIGAGITGAGIARDAALRGLSVALVEAGDVASGTSSRSSKMIHGGLRYLAQGDIGLVKEAASERQMLRAIAPHLTRYSDFVMPGSRSIVATMRAGLVAFERLGRVPRNERHKVLDLPALSLQEPLLRTEGCSGGVRYPEFLTNDARLTLANVRSAAEAGAVVLTHAPVVGIVTDNGRAVGVECCGALPGESLGATVRGRHIVNAAGPWVDAVRALESPDTPGRLTLTKGIHLVVRHERLPVRQTVITLGPDHRPVFAVPVHGMTYIGTTDTFYPDTDRWPSIERSDVDYLLDSMAGTFTGERIADDDIVTMWSGIRPLIAQQGKKPSEISRKDETWVGPAGIRSIAGGKLSAYRAMAERVVDSVVSDLGLRSRKCETHRIKLVGGDVDPSAALQAIAPQVSGVQARRLVDMYGSEATEVAADGGDVAAEVRHAVLREGVLRLEDYWVRRSERAWFTPDPVGSDLDSAAAVLGDLLGWTAQRRDEELAQCRQHHSDARACLVSTEVRR